MREVNGQLKTALAELRGHWAAGDYRKALKLAASWPKLGPQKAAIQQGWAAASNPSFYRQLGKDPQACYQAGLVAVAERYGLPYAPEGVEV